MKKFISFVMVVLMIVSNFNMSFASEQKLSINVIGDKGITNEDEIISVIIELDDKPLLASNEAIKLGAKEYLKTNSFRKSENNILESQRYVKKEILSKINADIEFKYEYTKTLNGFAANVKKTDIARIKELEGVKNIFFDTVYDAPTPKMINSGEMIGSSQLQNYGYRGEKTVIAVIDSGVYSKHEIMLLSDDNNITLTKNQIKDVLPSLNVKKMLTDVTVEDVYANAKFPLCFDYADKDTDPTPYYDTHGMHVAGIIGANGTAAKVKGIEVNAIQPFDGVAPEAQILGMKVFSDYDDSAVASVVMAAIEDAVKLNADAINLSLGSPAGFTFADMEEMREFEYDYSISNARKSGVFVAVAAGNSSRVDGFKLGYWANLENGTENPLAINPDTGLIASPATNFGATSVASIDNNWAFKPYIEGPSGEVVRFDDCGYYYTNGEVEFVKTLGDSEYEYVDCLYGREEDFENKVIKDKIVLMERGEIEFINKVNNAYAKGAKGCIIFNSEATDEILLIKLSGMEYIPTVMISGNNGLILRNATNKKIKIDKSLQQNEKVSDDVISAFGSWGSSPDLKLKPEITAPGGNIYSTVYYKDQDVKYEYMGGTSMASPQVAAAAALMNQHIRENTDGLFSQDIDKVELIEAILMSTAMPVMNKEVGVPYSPRQQGAGLMNLKSAFDTKAYLMNYNSKKSKIELGDNIGNSFNLSFDIINLTSKDIEYKISGNIMTDDYEKKDLNGVTKYFIKPNSKILSNAIMTCGTAIINGNSTTNTAITASAIIAKPGKTTVTVGVELDKTEVEGLTDIFTNGFYVEGFIELTGINGATDLSIPYMGFYNDWTKAKIIDGFYAYEEDSYNYFYGKNDIEPNAYMYWKAGGAISMPLGRTEKKGRFDWIAFSPNNDSKADEVGAKVALLRNAKQIDVEIVDSNKNIVRRLDSLFYLTKSYPYSSYGGFLLDTKELPSWDGKDSHGNIVDDGQYFYKITSYLDYERMGNTSGQELEIPVKVDNVLPTVEAVYDAKTKTVKVKASDNNHIFIVYVYNLETYEYSYTKLDEFQKEVEMDIDVSSFTCETVDVKVYDGAENTAQITLDLKEEIDPTPGEEQTPGGAEPVNPTPGPKPTPNPPAEEKIEVPMPALPEKAVGSVDGLVDISQEDWYYEDVKEMVENGLMKGVSSTEFAPNNLATRAMVATIIHRLVGTPIIEKEIPFMDVKENDWFANAVRWTNAADIVRGISATEFAPNKNITREQLATMVYRYVVAIGKGYEDGWVYELTFDDKESIGSWAYDAVCWMNQNGIILGKPGNVFDPQGNATRAEISAVLNRLIKLLVE